MKIALIVGINYYKHISPLWGCVNDALNVKSVLERNANGSLNFDCKILTASNPSESISKSGLKDDIEQMFKKNAEIALFYFSGHGYVEGTGGFLVTSECNRGDEGVSLNDVISFANKSPAANKVIILDSCHSGIAGSSEYGNQAAVLSEGLTILTASTEDQYASEENGSGVFTNLFVDALNGSAANLIGDITPGSIYAHIDQSLGAWEQRPVFKTNIKQFVSLRRVSPSIPLNELRRISELFPISGYEFKLDPTFESEVRGRDEGMPVPIYENTMIFALLQKYNRLNLLIPVDAPHMWHAAMGSKSCRLTVLGEHYRRLVEKGRI